MKLNYSADHKEPAPATINRLHPGQLQSSRENVIISTTALRFRDSVRGLGLSQSTRLGLLLSPGRHRSNPFGASPSSPWLRKKSFLLQEAVLCKHVQMLHFRLLARYVPSGRSPSATQCDGEKVFLISSPCTSLIE